MIVSNTSLSGVRDSVRSAALSNFSYFANTVLGFNIPEDLGDALQECLDGQIPAYLQCPSSPRQLAQAMHVWLTSQGYTVLGCEPIMRHEMLVWLELGEHSGEQGQTISLELVTNGVTLQWL